MAYLCQDDYARVRPGDYFPSPDYGNGRECDACGALTWHAARVTADEASTAKALYEAEVAESEAGRARIAREQAVYAREEQRLRDYDDGVIHDDDH